MSAGTQEGQEPGERSRGHGGLLLVGLLSLLSSRTHMTSPGMAPPTMGWALPHQPLRKCLTTRSHRDIISMEVPLSEDASLGQVDRKLASTDLPGCSPGRCCSWEGQQPVRLCLAAIQVLTHSTGPTFYLKNIFLIVLIIKPRASCLLGG